MENINLTCSTIHIQKSTNHSYKDEIKFLFKKKDKLNHELSNITWKPQKNGAEFGKLFMIS